MVKGKQTAYLYDKKSGFSFYLDHSKIIDKQFYEKDLLIEYIAKYTTLENSLLYFIITLRIGMNTN